MKLIFDTFIEGRPAPGGSKTAQVLMRDGEVVYKYFTSNGVKKRRPIVLYRDASKFTKPWQLTVAAQARRVYRGEPLVGPVACEMVFWMAPAQGALEQAQPQALGPTDAHSEAGPDETHSLDRGRLDRDRLAGRFAGDRTGIKESLDNRKARRAGPRLGD